MKYVVTNGSLDVPFSFDGTTFRLYAAAIWIMGEQAPFPGYFEGVDMFSSNDAFLTLIILN